MSFHPYTCPVIDKNISAFKHDLEIMIKELVVDVCPLLESSSMLEPYVKEKVEYFYSSAEAVFEGTRSSNEDLRKAAEHAISDLESQLGNQ